MDNNLVLKDGAEAHANFICSLANAVHVETYLELGLEEGITFNKMINVVPKCVGVDLIKRNTVSDKGILHITSTDNFFSYNKDIFDMIFIDADHSFEQVKKDFHNSIHYLKEDGIILFHDTDPVSKMYLEPRYCNDSYKIIDYVRSVSDCDIITLPIATCGLSIARRKIARRILKVI